MMNPISISAKAAKLSNYQSNHIIYIWLIVTQLSEISTSLVIFLTEMQAVIIEDFIGMYISSYFTYNY